MRTLKAIDRDILGVRMKLRQMDWEESFGGLAVTSVRIGVREGLRKRENALLEEHRLRKAEIKFGRAPQKPQSK